MRMIRQWWQHITHISSILKVFSDDIIENRCRIGERRKEIRSLERKLSRLEDRIFQLEEHTEEEQKKHLEAKFSEMSEQLKGWVSKETLYELKEEFGYTLNKEHKCETT